MRLHHTITIGDIVWTFVPPPSLVCACGTGCMDLRVEQEVARQADEAKQEHRVSWLARSGIPGALQTASLQTGEPTVAVQAVRAYLAGAYERGQCLVLAGPTGVGKSYAAAAALLDRERGQLWYFPALCAALLDDRRREAMRQVTESNELVVLDDLGVEYVKTGGLIETTLDEVFWHREGNRQPTIVTTNLTVEEFRARLSDRIVDRLRGPWGEIVACTGPSLRITESP